MKKIFWILLFVFILSACTSAPSSPYKAAKGSGYGYSEKSLGTNNYRIEFKIANGNTRKAEDYAILRAAELTISQGYDWFEVKNRYLTHNDMDKRNKNVNDSDRYSREQISRECGLLGCRTQVRSMPEPDVDNEILSREASVIVEIIFGKGIRPAKQNIYDALETRETLRAKLGVF